MDTSLRYYVERKKPDTEMYIMYDSIHEALV